MLYLRSLKEAAWYCYGDMILIYWLSNLLQTTSIPWSTQVKITHGDSQVFMDISKLIRTLNLNSSLPWLCTGDLNEIVKSHEEMGGQARLENQMREFRDVLYECRFADQGYVGQKYTWWKCLIGGITVWEWLDKAIANTKWLSLFIGSFVIHLESAFSDHKPIIIHPKGIPVKKHRPRRFEQVWLKEDTCHTTVELPWTPSLFSSSPMSIVESNLKAYQTKLRLWIKESFGNITQVVRKKKRQIMEAERQADHGGCAD